MRDWSHPVLLRKHSRDTLGVVGDRERLAALLEGVSLLAYLRRTGRRLRDGWECIGLDAKGLLTAGALEDGLDPDRPQAQACRLLLSLFESKQSIAGRGEARRMARYLFERWSQNVTTVPETQLVELVFEQAPFLWEPAFSAARASLVLGPDATGHAELVAPPTFERRLAEKRLEASGWSAFLGGSEARGLWQSEAAQRSVESLIERGAWFSAAKALASEVPETAEERLLGGRVLYGVGRFSEALTVLKGLRSPDARALRLSCQLRNGELAAARRRLATWERNPPTGEILVDLAAIAVRLHAHGGQSEKADVWIDRLASSKDPRRRARAEVLRAEACWDRSDPAGMRQALGKVGADYKDAWRFSHAVSLLAMAEGDGAGVVVALREALKQRRALRPIDAAGLWNDMAVGRAMEGDLEGAERALRHVVRLSRGSEGDRRKTLALCNLAEIRLRRGRLAGVESILVQSSRANGAAGNWRGWAHDQELWARFELARARPAAALARVDEALEQLETKGLSWRCDGLQVFAVRALGWLGRPEEALRRLEVTGVEDRLELELEEMVPLWALAGDPVTGLSEAQVAGKGSADEGAPGDSAAGLVDFWSAALDGGDPLPWRAVEYLEPYRWARLVFDLFLVAPQAVDGARRLEAAAILRTLGAHPAAVRLTGEEEMVWRALEHYLGRDSASFTERAHELLSAVSPESRLVWQGSEREVVLVEGPGGPSRSSVEGHGGQLVLQAPQLSTAQRAVLELLARDLPASLVAGEARRPHGGSSVAGVLGSSRAITEAMVRLRKLAASEMPILIIGETGTGKELAAQAVHRFSRRSSGPLLPVNCAAIAENLLLSELFGHVKGSFTGAESDRVGIFESARGGSVFLDEIGDLPPAAQGKLLRVLQEGEVRRVGESKARKVDTRIVAATHRDLEQMVEAGAFRQDLLFRLKVGRVEIPPLRDRGEDIKELSAHFLELEGASANKIGLVELSLGALGMIRGHAWPGNVRELRNVLAVAVALTEDGVIRPEHLDLPSEPTEAGSGYHESVEAYRRRLVSDALEAAGGNKSEAARQLGLSRQALSYLVRQLKIEG